MIEKFLDLKHLFRKSIKLLRIFLMWHQQSYLQTEKQQLFTLLKQDSASVAPLPKHNSVHQDDPTKATILNEQFQSVFSRKSPNTSNSLSFLCHICICVLRNSVKIDHYITQEKNIIKRSNRKDRK